MGFLTRWLAPQQKPVPSASYTHFYSFKPKQEALLLGKKVTVTFVDEDDAWDVEDFIPEIHVSWWDDNKLVTKTLYPAEVYSMLSHELTR